MSNPGILPADPDELREKPEWEEYRGYTKHEYDVITKTGRIYFRCWPNAGIFTAPGGQKIPESQVHRVRLSPDPFTRN